MPLKLVRRPKSPFWYLRGTVRGIRVEESTGTEQRRVAEEIRAKREAELLTESVHGRRAVATFAEAALSYMEHTGKTRFLSKVIDHFGTTPLSQIDQAELDKGARKVYPAASGATRNRQFYTPASAVLHHAAKRGWCDRPLIERPAPSEERVRWLTFEEADRLIEACSPHLKPLVVFLLYTGARAGEALWLDWRAVDLSKPQVTLETRKTRHGLVARRGVPLHPRVVATLANLPHRDGPVFRRPDGKPYEPASDDDADTSAGSRIKTAFAGACRRAGIKDFSPHDCRHTFATWHYRASRDLGALQRIGGWKSVRMVLRYAHTNVEELGESINRLDGGIFGDASQKKDVS